jgi:sterol 3beta-glucosyltransferase
LRITLATIGTRGDVQPYIGVARELEKRGHRVTVATHEEFGPMLAQYGLEHRPTGGNFRRLMDSELGRAWLNSGDSPFKYAKYARELFMPLQEMYCQEFDDACADAEGVVFYAMAVGGLYAAERRRLPVVAVAPWAMVPNREVIPVASSFIDLLPGSVKKWLGSQIMKLAIGSMTEPHNAYRKRVGLPPMTAASFLHHAFEIGTPTVHLFSEHVVPRPRDWAPQHQVAGFSFAPETPYEPPASLVDFLSSGSQPIYLGFGSMTGFEPEQLAELATRAARLAGVRAVVASGWAGLQPKPSDDVYVIDEIPHEWLFPRVSAVVHHGGAGTLATGFRFGKPTVVAAFFADQPVWGRLNEKLGSGPKPLARQSITAENLAVAIRKAVTDEKYRLRAEELAAKIATENGAARAAEMIETALLGKPKVRADEQTAAIAGANP